MQRQIWSSAPFVEYSMSIDRDYFSLPLLSGDNKVRWLAETNMVICSLCRRLNVYRPRLLLSPFAIQRQSSLMACRDKYGHLLLFGDLTVFRPRLLQSPFLHLETTKSNGMRRPSWSLAFVVPRLSKSPYNLETSKSDGMREQIMVSRFSLFPRLLKSHLRSGDNQVRWPAVTNYGHLPPLVEDSMSFDRDYCSLPLLSRDNQVW